MSEALDPKYGPPSAPNVGGEGTPNPDAGKDYGYLVPNLQVVWSDPPTFNADPRNIGSGGDSGSSSEDAPWCPPIRMKTGSVRDSERRMLAAARTATAE